MLRRFLCAVLILALACVELPACIPAALAEEVVVDASITETPVEAQDIAEDDIYEDAETSSYAELKRGDRDGDDSAHIITLQNKLIEMGYLRDTADGVYGANTESAVAAFQRNNGLTETGVADGATQNLLYNGTGLITASNSMDPESVTYRVQDKPFQLNRLRAKDAIMGR